MRTIITEVSLSKLVIANEYSKLKRKIYHDLDFNVQQFEEYLYSVLNYRIHDRRGEATLSPYKSKYFPIPAVFAEAFQSIDTVIDRKRNVIYVPKSNFVEFNVSHEDIVVIQSYLKDTEKEDYVSRVSNVSDISLEVMSSRVDEEWIYTCDSEVNPIALKHAFILECNNNSNYAMARQLTVSEQMDTI